MSSEELPKSYDPSLADNKWGAFWLKHHLFDANPKSAKPKYSLVMPPPNVTGRLHMGHALVNTLQDILVRWKRMSGFEVLWVPGTDHAGIATQTVVERHLIKTEKKRRTDFEREEFLSHVWKWKEENESFILSQIKKLGCSCDWSRLRFTMDEPRSKAVRAMFKKLYEDGLIYQGDYLVNWDPVTETALADDEVEYEEKQGFLWFIKYPVIGTNEHIVIATTRPETMLGDTAVAVSPKDARYAHLVGKRVLLPLSNREVPIIADPFVEEGFGTGAVKITPAHDQNDYQMALRHGLPMISIMTSSGKINANGGSFEGLSMEQAREAVIAELTKLGFFLKKEPHTNRVGVSYRSKAIIEPHLSKQWFIRMEEFKGKLKAAVEEEKTLLIPKTWESVYFHWINNLRDWCISRQLWWGHRIPIWHNKTDPTKKICYIEEGLPEEVKKNPDDWEQDKDVLDTWFSSALWPFSTLGWPEKTDDLQAFYPNSVLVTGHDILFFWVARMLMMGEYALGKVPFKDVYLHGLIYGKSYWRKNPDGGITYVTEEERKEYDLGKPTPKDVFSKWEKMSKSKGNVIDPMELIDSYGADATRMALAASATSSRQIDLERRRLEDFKNFANKIWNGARFVFLNLTPSSDELSPLTAKEFDEGIDPALFQLEDRWILSILNRTIAAVNRHLSAYEFDLAATKAYDFFWNDFCAYYLEISKPVLNKKAGTDSQRKVKQKMLLVIMEQALRLIHPFAPFISEELFSLIKERFGSIKGGQDPYTKNTAKSLTAIACAVSSYPQPLEPLSEAAEVDFKLLSESVYAIRNIRGEMKIPPGMATDVYFVGNSLDLLKKNTHILQSLVKVQSIHFSESEDHLPFGSQAHVNGLKVILPLPQQMKEQEAVRLEKEKEKTSQNLEKLSQMLASPDFSAKAPPELIKKQESAVQQLKNQLKEIESKLLQLKG